MTLPAPDLVTRWQQYEKRYLPQRYTGSGTSDSLHLTSGTSPILISAVHSVTHSRDGARKAADMATGGLADLLADLTGSYGITLDGPPSRDPNYDPDGPAKTAVEQLRPHLRAAIDLHGIKDDWGIDVCIGRGAHPEKSTHLVTATQHALAAAGFTVTIGYPFDAASPETFTSTHQGTGLPAVQLELAKRLRTPWDQPDISLRLITALQAAIAEIVQHAAI